jgi:hypothetical protein
MGFELEREVERLASLLRDSEPSLSIAEYEKVVSSHFSSLGQAGYSREQMYLIAFGLSESDAFDLTSNKLDAVRNFETTLTGLCAKDAIFRVSTDPNEPFDEDDFAEYVRSLKWTQDPKIQPKN